MNKQTAKNSILTVLSTVSVLASLGCDKTDRSFSLLAASSSFQQTPAVVVNQKVDILWVVDNSGSMSSSQQNLINNFNSFITKMQSLNYDFHIAVTTTDAYMGNFYAATNPTYATFAKAFRRGVATGNSSTGYYYNPDSGVSVINNLTPNLTQTFVTNASQGILGSGDERAFSSFKDSLDPTFTTNAGFRRPDAFLSIIIVSDEDDFSANTLSCIACKYRDEVNSDPVVLPAPTSSTDYPALYLDPALTPVSSYKTFLDGLVPSGKYSVSVIAVIDNTCKAQLNNSFVGRRIGRRYMQLADLTKGIKTSLCDNFGTNLQMISNSILELSSAFKLDRAANPTTIQVVVNGVTIPQDAVNGWTYDATTLNVTFHGNAIPPSGASILITFDPLAPKI